jgi:hypothetical protein
MIITYRIKRKLDRKHIRTVTENWTKMRDFETFRNKQRREGYIITVTQVLKRTSLPESGSESIPETDSKNEIPEK